MICCFSLDPNDVKAGGVMGFYVQALTEPDKVVNKKCIVKVYEIDTLVGKRKETTPDDLLAEFETVIEKGSRELDFYFNLEKTKRTDGFSKELPEPEIRNDPKGNPLPVPLKHTPPYFRIFFDSGAPHPSDSDLHTILIRCDRNEPEMYNYEIGFTIELDSKIIFDARKMVAYVECSELLADNCRNAAEFIIRNHNKHLLGRSCGTYNGNMFPYRFNNENEYLRQVERINPSSVEELRGNWKDDDKLTFNKQLEEYGLKMTSCIDFVLESFELGFSKSLMLQEWKKCSRHLTKKRSGQELAKGLIDLGWIALFYAPDTIHIYDLDQDKTHTHSFNNAKKRHEYGYPGVEPIIPVFDFVINYKPTTFYEDGTIESKPITPELDQIKKVVALPFAFLFARYGQHTALLVEGKVWEVHWTKGPDEFNVFSHENSFVFQPKKMDNSSVTNTWEWLSGLIVTPRSFWPQATYKFL